MSSWIAAQKIPLERETMDNNHPRVSIGLAVYNGEKYLEEAVDSILDQTYQDFELIISDNASTDRTEEICRKYAAQDDRVRYYRNKTNIGGANNENSTVPLARGEYFRWAAYDDVCAPELLEKSVAVLDREPSVVLCFPMVNDIDETGNVMRTSSLNQGLAPTAHERLRELADEKHHCESFYGLIRTDILRKTYLQQNYTGSDRTLLAELSLYGRFYEIPEPLFFKRYHPQNNYVNARTRMAWFDPSLKGKFVFPYWMQFIDYLKTIWRVPLPWSEKIRCYAYMVRWFGDHAKNLAGDIILPIYVLLRPRKDPYAWRNANKDVYNWE
jgi:glycosyltransferase involved in cell wall biosynthesis